MTELNTTGRRKPFRILAAALALSLAGTSIPVTAFAASGDHPHLDRGARSQEYRGQRHDGGGQRAERHRDNDRGDRRGRGYRGDHRRGGHYDRTPPAYRYGNRGYHRRHDHDDNDAAAAAVGAIFGFAVGAMVADSYNRSYDAPPSRTYYNAPTGPAPVSSEYAPEPFTDDWYAYCASKYRSFDPDTGTFQPYEGPRKLCQ
ncbi:BA14K family protein [Tepidamorphus sp. 3E244]|uniref:BA14K family protein n=1 Tax=Tepidamorphus sp. 3E244 TaxID=3385498 RepID=UPI0038FC0DD3